MKGWKKIQEWLHEWLRKEFVITGATQVGWSVYLMGGEPKKVRVFKDSFLLKRKPLLGKWRTTRIVKDAKPFNKVVGSVMITWLEWKYKKLFFRLVVTSQASFIAGLQPPRIESPIGIITLEN